MPPHALAFDQANAALPYDLDQPFETHLQRMLLMPSSQSDGRMSQETPANELKPTSCEHAAAEDVITSTVISECYEFDGCACVCCLVLCGTCFGWDTLHTNACSSRRPQDVEGPSVSRMLDNSSSHAQPVVVVVA